MRRRRLLSALSAGVAASSGCLSTVEAPALDREDSRPPLAREDFVSSEGNAQREAVIPNVSLLPMSTASSTDGDESRVVPAPQDDSGNESAPASNESRKSTPVSSETSTSRATETSTSVAVSGRDFEEQGLYVTDDFWQYRTHVHRYAVDEVTTTVFPTEPSTDTPVKVVVAASVYPRGGLVDSVASEPFRPDSSARRVTVPMDLSAAPDGVPLQYVAAVVPESVEPTEIHPEDLHALMETDPFVVADDLLERVDRPERLAADSGRAFDRQPVEGGYVQTLRGRTKGRSWEVSFLAFDSAYVAAKRRSRGRARAEYVSYELLEGAANEIAEFVYEAAENNGFTSEFERIQFALSFVQRLPYVSDDVSTGYDDYTKFIMETLTSFKGDCEDTSILFASILESEPFNYNAVLLEPPGHMAVGLLMEKDFEGFSYIYDGSQYFYVETTTEGWGIGQIPDQYRETKARIYDV
ncbi:hypothetical protein G9C85_16750 [Halorubellus sp. JP-L1]|uniref:hypothetical protein n=1 Tax=Halorubellus sp. JP-L1 TaxID=2715753 RepID=UPI0014092A92|nr:hypothetical protein [Halorubellus sp. JP-L1]NHN43268.1 hypothetical protein [Halorubellus sp. JP-L1]